MALGLEKNPFEWASQNHKMVDREDEWHEIVRVMRDCIGADICRFVLIFGDYGMGKSFILEEMYRKAQKTKGVIAVHNVLQQADVITEKPISTRRFLIGSSESEFDISRNILLGLDSIRVIELINKAGKLSDIGPWERIFQNLKKGDVIAWRYLTGERLRKDELETLGVKDSRRSPDAMIEGLFAVLRLMKKADYNTLLVLVDEFEFIRAHLGDKAVVAVLSALRTIFDDFAAIKAQAAKIVFVFGVSTQAWDKIMDLESTMRVRTGGGGIAPFTERILPSDKVTLSPFSEEASLELVKSRLAEVRKPNTSNPYAPFDEIAVKYIHKVSRQKPRVVLQNCYMITEEAMKDSGRTSIDVDFAKRVLAKYNIAEPSDE